MRKQPYSQSNMASGLVTSLDPTLISAKDSPNVLNTRLSRGLLAKDFALTPFGLPVLGYPMLQDLYHQDDGTRSYILITTTSVYIWEGTVSEWVDITEGLDIENCEAAWDDSANVVSSAVEDAKEGTYATKFAIAAAFTTGIAATNVISAVNLDGVTHVHLWVKSSIALDAGDIQLLLDDTAECASPLETLDVPAVAANTWTRVSVALSDPASALAIISVGLNIVNGKGAVIEGTIPKAYFDRVSGLDGAAFIDLSGVVDLTAYIGGKLTITDSAGKKIIGYIKAAGTGETLSDELTHIGG